MLISVYGRVPNVLPDLAQQNLDLLVAPAEDPREERERETLETFQKVERAPQPKYFLQGKFEC